MTIRSLTRPTTERTKSYGPVTLVDTDQSGIFRAIGAGSRRGNVNALLYFRQNFMLRAVVEHIAWEVAQLPLRAYRLASSAPSSKAKEYRKQIAEDPRARKTLIDQQDITEIRHPAIDLLNRPNLPTGRLNALSRFTFFVALQEMLTLCSEAFVRPIRIGGTGEPFELEPINPTWVSVDGKGLDARWIVDDPDRGKLGPFDATGLLYIRHPDPANPYGRPVGMGATLADEIDASEAAAQYQSALLRNHGMPKVMIGIEGGETPVDQKVIDQLNEEWRAKYGGVQRAGQVHFFSRKITSQIVGYSPTDLQMDTAHDASNRRIREGFTYPPEWLGILDNSNRSTISESRLIRAESVIKPQVVLHEDWINGQLFPLFGATSADVFAAFDSCLPEDYTREDEAAKAAPWALDRDEWRQRIGYDPAKKGGDVVFVPASLVPYTPEGIEIQASATEYEPQDPAEIAAMEANPEGSEGAEGSEGSDPESEAESEPEDEPIEEETDEEDDAKALSAEVLAKVSDPRVQAVLRAVERVGLRDKLTPTMRQELRRWIRSVVTDLDLEIPTSVSDVMVTNYLADFAGMRIGQIDATTQRWVRRTLARGVARGESDARLAARLRKVFGSARAAMIARTETHRARNWSVWQVHSQASKAGALTLRREWITHPEATVSGTRDAHKAMHNQVRDVTEPFTAPDGSTAMYPGGFGVPGLDIGCVCEQRLVIAGRTLSLDGSESGVESLRMTRAKSAGFTRRFEQKVNSLLNETLAAALAALQTR